MKTLPFALAALAATLSLSAVAGDPVAGKQKATACVVCHGSENFGGIFYTLQLAGRNADKLAIKTNKYKTLKVLHPMMNMATAFYTEKEIEDVSAYYQSIGKPFLTSPFFTIKGDEEAQPAAAAPVAPVAAAPYAVATK
ncbi:MAG: hypothetical protein AB1899_12040 [Pseudomonadota bacterium]